MTSKTIPVKTFLAKPILIISCLIFSIGFIIFAKWCFGNSISTQVSESILAEFAISLAPSDPQTHYSLAVVKERTFLQEDQKGSLDAYLRSLSLSPHDYRLWLAVAKALDRSGQSIEAEFAFKKALQLAPNYAQVTWAYGNYLLRQGNTASAFVEIRKAAESNKSYLQPAVSIAWQFLQGDLAEIRKVFEASPELNSMLAVFLANEKRFEESAEIWNTLNDLEKSTRFIESGNTIFQNMVRAKKLHRAQEIFNGMASVDEEKFAKEQISNGSFEKDVKPSGANVFDWQLGTGIKPQVLFDERQKSEGNRSLVIEFNSSDGHDFRSLSQTVVIQPNKLYELSLSYRSELKTTTTLRWEVVDLEGNVIAETQAIENQSGWAKVSLPFSTPDAAEAVNIRLARVKCPQGICPITGRVWFDDFRLGY